jgi:uncharacterized protein YcfJ
MTRWRSDSTLARSADRRETRTGDPAVTDRIVERETITDDGIERRETLREDYVPGAGRHGDEEAGGAVAGGVAGAVVGAVVGGPVGAVVGGAIGAATGATAGAIDQKHKDDEVVVKHDERPL